MAKLILIRHGESEWNKIGLWTGWTDISLSERGRQEARSAGETLKNIEIDEVFTSKLSRSKQTWDEIAKVLGFQNIHRQENEALNERNYGDFTGKNKWDIQKELGEDKFQEIRRGWDTPIPNGESLKDVYERVIPYYVSAILPLLKQGRNVLIAAHGNSLRSLIKYLDHISDDDIPHLELKTGEVYIYSVDEKGDVVDREVLSEHLQS